MTEVSIGLVGAGYWGAKLARCIFDASGCRLTAACDPDQQRLEAIVGRYPGVRGLRRFEDMLTASDVDALVLATPAARHAEQAGQTLRAGKHLLVEKPLALSSVECERICVLAEANQRVLMVGHTFIYSEPVRTLRRYVERGEFGELLYAYSQRVNLGIIRDDLNALWNFGPHDISILVYLLDEVPVRVSARQFRLLQRARVQDVAFVVLEFPSGVIGHIHESWLDPRKVRQFTLVGDRKMAVYDDTDTEGPLRVYDKGVSVAWNTADGGPKLHREESFGEFKLEVRSGDMVVPRIAVREPLRVELEHFAECIVSGERPLTDGRHGSAVVRVLEAAERSTSRDGQSVEVEPGSVPIGAGPGAE